jgi:hypothetical protein
LLALRPSYAKEMRADFRSRRFDRSIVDKIVEGLRKAGFEVADEAESLSADVG